MSTGLYAVNLCKSFGKKPILTNVTLDINRGEIVGILGPNGAGKTTCFYSIAGLVRPDSGQVYLDGSDITFLPMYRRARLGLGYLPQDASIFRGLSVENNLRAVLEITYPSRSLQEHALDSLLRDFNLTSIRKTKAVSLSGGERRRVEIARTLATNPRFVLFDEPLTGIDPIAINDIHSLMTYLRDKNIGVVITDHNVQAILDIVDRLYILYSGTILKHGKPSDILTDKDVQRVYLGENHFYRS